MQLNKILWSGPRGFLLRVCAFTLLYICCAHGQTRLYHLYSSGFTSPVVDVPIGVNQRGDWLIAGASNSASSVIWMAPTTDASNGFEGTLVGMNNERAMTGWTTDSSGRSSATYIDPSWGLHIIPTLGGSANWGYAINQTELIVGASVNAQGKTHAFSYQGDRFGGVGGTPRDLGAFSGGFSEARGVNNLGQIVGDSSLSNGYFHAFVFNGRTMSDLGTLGGSSSYALAINDSGMVAGYSYTFGNAAIHPFLIANGTMRDLGTLGGTVAEATAINSMGQVVGWSYTANNAEKHAFLYSNGTMTDLNTLSSGQGGWILASAWAISDLGEIAGYLTYATDVMEYTLIPGFASNCVPNNYATQFADVSGDQLADQIVVNDTGIVVLRNTGLGMFGPAGEVWSTTPFAGTYHIDGLTLGNAYFADVDGDGKADAVSVNDASTLVRRSDGSKFLPTETWASGLIARSYHISGVSHPNIYFVDVNHDGAADAVSVDDNGVWVQLADKINHVFGTATNWSGGAFYGTNGTFFADVTGDGSADAIAVNRNIISGYPAITVRPSTNANFGASQSFASARYFPTAFADVTGDGAADEIMNLGSAGFWVGPSVFGSFNFFKNPAWSAPVFYGDFGSAYASVDYSTTYPNTVDRIKLNSDGIYVETSYGSSFSPYTVWSYPFPTYGNRDTVCH